LLVVTRSLDLKKSIKYNWMKDPMVFSNHMTLPQKHNKYIPCKKMMILPNPYNEIEGAPLECCNAHRCHSQSTERCPVSPLRSQKYDCKLKQSLMGCSLRQDNVGPQAHPKTFNLVKPVFPGSIYRSMTARPATPARPAPTLAAMAFAAPV